MKKKIKKSKKKMFDQLPCDIYNYNIYSFLTTKDIIIFKNTSKKFKDTKIPFLFLNRKLSLQYYYDTTPFQINR
uniref:F-box domain-containing protein n=1 Tax=viral metagenome TaxID=1070528 RepID=A0A6C0ADL8_9ZZZZ